MSFLIGAVGAVLSSLLETSVLPEVRISLDLVMVFALVSSMLLGVERGLTWALLGGLMLDLVTPGVRALGSTALCLLLTTGAGMLIARITQPPRIGALVISVFALTFAYHALLTIVLAATEGVGLGGFSFASVAVAAVLNALVAALVGRLIRMRTPQFSPAEHTLR